MGSETHFSLRWNNFGSTLTTSINFLHRVEDFVDVTLAVQGIQFKAHKLILSSCSSYFWNILKANPCQHPVIILKEVAIEDIKSVLTFMYEGEVQVTQARLPTFMRLAEALQVRGLTESPLPSHKVTPTDKCGNAEISNKKHPESSCLSLDLSRRSKSIAAKCPINEAVSSSTLTSSAFNGGEAMPQTPNEACDIMEGFCSDFIINKKRKLSSNSSEPAIPSANGSVNQTELSVTEQTGNYEVKMEAAWNTNESLNNDSIDREGERPRTPSMASAAELRSVGSCAELDERNSTGGQSDTPDTLVEGHQESPIPDTSSCKRSQSRYRKPGTNHHPEFPQDQSLNQGSLPYPCPFCEKCYTSWGFRRRHIKGCHTGTSELPCKWCLTILPSTQDWQNHVTRSHSLTHTDAHNGILILEEAHMVLQVAQPTRIASLMELIKNKKIKDKNETETNSTKETPG